MFRVNILKNQRFLNILEFIKQVWTCLKNTCFLSSDHFLMKISFQISTCL